MMACSGFSEFKNPNFRMEWMTRFWRIRTVHNAATVKIEIGGMADGQEAGLCHFAQTYCTIGLQQLNGRRVLKFNSSRRAKS
ncbi:hypothetical protein KZ483_09230 [Paenibacillus sp. sptzw28]|nr:hypothetical protein KZ483_09230 [Paenibacillus sp. sptzw28]